MSNTKPCAFCHEDILSRARKCKHCGEWQPGDQLPAERTIRLSIDPEAHLRERLGTRYTLLGEIGRGGMGIVYRARRQEAESLIALKVLPPHLLTPADRDEYVERFRRETEALQSLPPHEHVVRVYESGEVDGYPYMEMELVEGRPLDQLLREEGPLPFERVVTLGAPLARALAHAHRHEIVHRDVKASNIRVTDEDRPVLLDFGIARPKHTHTLTQKGTALGTPQYMSPEQANGHPATYQSDLYSLGVVLYECLCGAAPFAGANTMSTLYKIVHEPPTPVKNRRPDAPLWLITILHRALAKSHHNRYTNGDSLANDLERGLKTYGSSPGPVQTPRLDRQPAIPASKRAADPDKTVKLTAQDRIATKRPPRGSNGEAAAANAASTSLWARRPAWLKRTPKAEQPASPPPLPDTPAKPPNASTPAKAPPKPKWVTAQRLRRTGRLLLSGVLALVTVGVVVAVLRPQPIANDPWVGIELVEVPAGSFRMGDLFGDGDADERPIRQVTLDGYQMSAHEITYEQYDLFAEETGRPKPSSGDLPRGDYPVSNVSWNDAVAFSAWLSRRTGETVRLPTEAEWEYAARDGGKAVRYPWGNVFEGERLNYDGDGAFHNRDGRQAEDGYPLRSPVGSYPANDLGLY
ncbi:MAG: bifunctional serine/threonine-protein kinase/formylglycine-generating enzyme family protein, partial [Bacteroidota bacterium]